jgi:hypothetical protein
MKKGLTMTDKKQDAAQTEAVQDDAGPAVTAMTGDDTALQQAIPQTDANAQIIADSLSFFAMHDVPCTTETLSGQVGALLSERKAMLVKITELEADAAARVAPPPPPAKAVKTLSIHPKAKAGDFDTAVIVAFTDESGAMTKDLPVLTFGPEQFSRENGNRNLNATIEFPVAIPQFVVATAWLVSDDGKPVARYDLVQPVIIGGGRAQRFNPGTLSFAFATAPVAA